MPKRPPNKCAAPNCRRRTHYRYCRQHRAAATTTSWRFRLPLTLSEFANLCGDISQKGVDARAELTENGIALHFDNKVEPPQRADVTFQQLLAISTADKTTELMQSILRSFAREAQEMEQQQEPSAAA